MIDKIEALKIIEQIWQEWAEEAKGYNIPLQKFKTWMILEEITRRVAKL
jgi:hypothetical protein